MSGQQKGVARTAGGIRDYSGIRRKKQEKAINTDLFDAACKRFHTKRGQSADGSWRNSPLTYGRHEEKDPIGP